MKKFLIISGVILASITFGSPTFAAYDSSSDITLDVNLLPNTLEFSDSTGEATFELQEDVHNALTESTGTEVDHSYIWVTVNGKKVLAVDPPKPCF
jgi:hypothetical protein